MTSRDQPDQAHDAMPTMRGFHHVRLPVSDVLRSRDWYCDVFGFKPVLDLEEEDQLVGVALEHPAGISLGIHLDPGRGRALQGFALVAFVVDSRRDLDEWLWHFGSLGLEHSEEIDAHRGWYVQVNDPDGIVIVLQTTEQPSADEA
jgi:catechol 2,3-dioxygenase-like lactoylglutathione lyase family enzyme